MLNLMAAPVRPRFSLDGLGAARHGLREGWKPDGGDAARRLRSRQPGREAARPTLLFSEDPFEESRPEPLSKRNMRWG